MHTNRLSSEKSPYLLQHAHNPVDWYPWSEEAFEKARSEDKPIFLSVGYSTCHWCHVMERESFESESIASILNRHYVSIKVDREERPDVDRIYMAFVQATSGSGGWPMSVFLTPDRKPFFGGTYFPPDNRYGRPGFGHILESLAHAWRNDRAKIVDSADEVIRQLAEASRISGATGVVDPAAAESCFHGFRRMYDSRLGGFGSAPKFPRPAVHAFLLRYAKRTGNAEATEMVEHTLLEMAAGGMNDQLGGGFHRYSVDDRWFVPHFEKMLYDQAQLAISCLETWQVTRNPRLAEIAREIFEYVLRDLTHPDGGFYSAEDADSVIDPAHPHEKGEGAFYIWSDAEIGEIVGQPGADWFRYRYGMLRDGNVRNDPHQEFTGKNILYQAHSVEETAAHFQQEPAEVEAAMEQARARLLEARGGRIRPHLDDKVLTSWNGLMISAFALGAQVLEEPRYRHAAVRATYFILDRLFQTQDTQLLRRYRDDDSSIPGFLDDYAFFIQALLDLYETTFEWPYLETALDLTDAMRRRFEDPEGGGFYTTAEGDPHLVIRVKDDYDGAEPAGNSVALAVLLRLAEITGRDDLRGSAEKLLGTFASRLRSTPWALPQMMAAVEFTLSKPRQIILAGSRDSEEAAVLLREIRQTFLPHKIVLFADGPEVNQRIVSYLPTVAAMRPVDGRTTAYVCENYACQLPTSDREQLAALLR